MIESTISQSTVIEDEFPFIYFARAVPRTSVVLGAGNIAGGMVKKNSWRVLPGSSRHPETGLAIRT